MVARYRAAQEKEEKSWNLDFLGEPNLRQSKVEAYRYYSEAVFDTLRCWRLERTGDRVVWYYKVYEEKRKGGTMHDKLYRDSTAVLTLEHWNAFKLKLEEAHFWEMPDHLPSTSVWLDAEYCVMEGVDPLKEGRKHKQTSRLWGKEKPICELGGFLKRLPQMKIK